MIKITSITVVIPVGKKEETAGDLLKRRPDAIIERASKRHAA